LVTGIQDFGAAGLSCATSELASAGSGGMQINLDAVPLRDPTLLPEEILMSESQERMMAVVRPQDVELFMAICVKWDVQATVVGEVIAGDRLLIDWHGERVVDVDPRTVAHEGPVYERPIARPTWIDRLRNNRAEDLPRPQSGAELADQLLRLLGSSNLCDVSWVTDQYDRFVRGNSILAQPEDAGMIRIDPVSGLGIALAVDCNARFAYLDPYRGAQLALLEAYRNVAVSGAEPVAVTDCLNFGSPEDPEVMWQFQEAIRGLVDACRSLGTPVTGGNVSFYNKTGDQAILPTPTIGMLGVIDNVAWRIRSGFQYPGDAVYLIGRTREELSGSAWADVIHGHLGGEPPLADFEQHRRLTSFCVAAAKAQLLTSAHDLADGGLAIALAESCLRYGQGVEITLAGDPFLGLFSETSGRLLVSVNPDNEVDLIRLANDHDVRLTRLGQVTDSDELTVEGQFSLRLAALRRNWRAPIPVALGLIPPD
jgi:phosphoribosylformylglycinamidine synthase